VSPITNSKTGIFEILSKKERKYYVTFKTGILWGPVIKVTTKVKLHEGNQLGSLMQFYAVNLKVMSIEFCAVDKNESVSTTFWQ